MTTVFVFSITLLVGVLLSELFRRSILSTALLFLVTGFVLGEGVLDVIALGEANEVVLALATFALIAVLFADGMKVGARDLVSAWRLPGRALVVGMPLAVGATALLARGLTDLSWLESFLIGAALAPTDPVFAAAIIGREEIPSRLRHLLNVESGVNDGLALPVVIALLAALGGSDQGALAIAEELLLGLVIGVAVPWLAVRAERSRLFSATEAHQPLYVLAIGLVVFGLSELVHANAFLAAFAAGVTLESMSPGLSEAFHRFGELVAELLKLAALLVFASLISPSFLGEIPVGGYVFAALVLVAVRSVTMSLALVGSPLERPEWMTAAWFGPKGFASVVYGLLILQSGIDAGDEIFHLAALTIMLSMIAHSSTDVAVARWLQTQQNGAGVSKRRSSS